LDVHVLHINDDSGDRVHAFESSASAWLSWSRYPPVAKYLQENGIEPTAWAGVPEAEREQLARDYSDGEGLATVEVLSVEAAAYVDGALL
jgi:hypothetical protein